MCSISNHRSWQKPHLVLHRHVRHSWQNAHHSWQMRYTSLPVAQYHHFPAAASALHSALCPVFQCAAWQATQQ